MRKWLIILVVLASLLATTLLSISFAQAASTPKPILIPITLHSGEPGLPNSSMNLRCKKNTPCFTVKNETRQTVYWWWQGLKPIPSPVTSIVFVGTILKPGESKTFSLNDQLQICKCSTHIFRIWYNGLNHDGLEVHTY